MTAKNKKSVKPVKKITKTSGPQNSPLRHLRHLGEKFLEHEIFTLIGKGLGWLIENLHVVIPLVVGTVGAIGTTFALIYSSFVEDGLNSKFLLYAKDHPDRISALVIISVVLSPVIKLISAGIKILISRVWQKKVEPSYVEELPPISAAESLILATGISGFYPHSKTEKRKDWRICVDKIKQHRATDLRIMGASGWNTFGAPQAPLYKLLEQFNGEIKILLIEPDPALPSLIQRAQATLKTPERYAQEVSQTLDRLKFLKKGKGKNISVRLYKQTPIWKMVISNDFMWLQHYWKGRDVDDTSVYTIFSDGEEGTSLFHPFYSVWFKRWESDGNESYDL